MRMDMSLDPAVIGQSSRGNSATDSAAPAGDDAETRSLSTRHLDALEAESIHILREIAAECTNVALLFSGGKDSAVVLHLARKAFFPQRIPFRLLHVDTGHNFPEVIAYRDEVVAKHQLELIVRTLDESIRP